MDTPATPESRKARVDAIIGAGGDKVPEGVKLIDFRELTPKEREFAKTLQPRVERVLSRKTPAAA